MGNAIVYLSIAVIGVVACKRQEDIAKQEIDRWNTEFINMKTLCEGGNPTACRKACQMSKTPTVCDNIALLVDKNDPTQKDWVTNCRSKALTDGQVCCYKAENPTPAASATSSAPPTPSEPERKSLLDEMTPAKAAANSSETATQVKGSLPKAVIRRIMTQHLSKVKSCYEQRLAASPTLAGRVAVKFIISGTGQVQLAAVAETTIEDPEMESCVVEAVKRIKFPQPEGGGIVIVTYPFEFKPAS